MDRFGKEEFRQLLDVESYPAISIFMPIERTEMTFKSLRLQLRAHIDEAAETLESIEELEADDYEPLIARLRQLADDREFFNQTGEGLALFMARGFEAVYFLPVAFDNLSVVGTTFHTRPLLEHIAAPTDYWVLAIGQKEVTFWEGSPTGVKTVELENLPQSLQEALLLEMEKGQDLLNFRSGGTFSMGKVTGSASGAGGGRSGLPSPMFHGHGGGRDEHNAYLRKYFLRVAEGIREYLGGAEGPLILAAVDYCHPIFHSISKLKNLAEEGIEGNVHFWNDKEIYEAAWPIAKKELDKRRKQVLEEWERAYGRGSAEVDLNMVARRTVEGRVHRLILDEEASLWGHYDRRTGKVETLGDGASEEERARAADIFDEIAEAVIQQGGDVVVLPREKMPAPGGIGAILRGNGG